MAKITHTGPSCLTALSAYGFSNRLTAGPTVLICNTVPPRQTQSLSKISAMAKIESFRKGEK